MVALVELRVHLARFPRRGVGVTADKATEEENVKAKSREGSALFCAGKIKCKWEEGWFSRILGKSVREDGFDGSGPPPPRNDALRMIRLFGNEWTLTEIACTRIDRGDYRARECIDSRVFNLCFLLFWCWMKKKKRKLLVLTFIAK